MIVCPQTHVLPQQLALFVFLLKCITAPSQVQPLGAPLSSTSSTMSMPPHRNTSSHIPSNHSSTPRPWPQLNATDILDSSLTARRASNKMTMLFAVAHGICMAPLAARAHPGRELLARADVLALVVRGTARHLHVHVAAVSDCHCSWRYSCSWKAATTAPCGGASAAACVASSSTKQRVPQTGVAAQVK